MLYIKQYPICWFNSIKFFDFKSNFQDIRQDVLYSGFSNNKLL